MFKDEREFFIERLRKGWEYHSDIKVLDKSYVVLVRHIQTNTFKMVKICCVKKFNGYYMNYINEILRNYEFRKWRNALNKL